MGQYKSLVKKVSIPPEKKTKQKEYLKEGVLPIVDQGQHLIGGYSDKPEMQLNCTLPVIVFGDHTKAVKYIDFPFGAGADGIKVLQPNPGIVPKYLYYATRYLVLRLEDKGYARHYQHVEKKELEIPDWDEQQRIVARIEELFSQLDNAVATLNAIKQHLAVYRQAVLEQAFSSCTSLQLASVCMHVTDGDHMPPPKAEHGIPFIMISNIDSNKINWTSTCYVGLDYYNGIGEKRTPQKGDVLYTVTGSYGIPVLVDFDKKFCFQRHIALLRPNELITQKFLYYALQAPAVYAQAAEKATGTAQKTVGLNVLRQLKIPFIADKSAQKSIVNAIEERISACDKIGDTVAVALLQAEALRQSILKKAFEGRL